jgi:hypothetical protein
MLIIFRNSHDPQSQLKATLDSAQQILTNGGFSNFVQSETKIGSRVVMTLDFDQDINGHGRWYCRHFYIVDGTHLYVLGFGTEDREAMFPLFDRIAKTFVTND